jgi:hypothetical protein
VAQCVVPSLQLAGAMGYGVNSTGPRLRWPLANAALAIVQQETFMRENLLILFAAAAIFLSPQFAFADGDGAATGLVGGAVAGAVVGGPVGAVVGGVAGGVVGGAVTGPGPDVLVVQPVSPCDSSTTRSTDNRGNRTTT